MSEIKSKKVKEFIMSIVEPTPTPNEELVFYVEMTAKQVVEAIIIAEQEAEERHTKQLQELRDRAAIAFYYNCNACDGDGGCRLRDNQACQMSCKKAKLFTQKLTQKL